MGITPRRRWRRAKKITAMDENYEMEERERESGGGKLEQRRGQRGGEAARQQSGAMAPSGSRGGGGGVRTAAWGTTNATRQKRQLKNTRSTRGRACE